MFEAVVADEIGALGAFPSTRAAEDVNDRDMIRGECGGTLFWGGELGVICGWREGRHLVGWCADGPRRDVYVLESLSSLLVTGLGGCSVGSVLDHKNVCTGACAKNKNKGPNFEASSGVRGSRSARNVGSNELVGLKDRGQDRSCQR